MSGQKNCEMFGKKDYIKCPRCGEKAFKHEKVCDNCKLVFSRLEYATNKAAKRAIKQGRGKTDVIKSLTLPHDVSKWKLLLICAFGGVVGAHNIYVGRYIKGFFSLFFITLLVGMILLVESAVLAKWFSNFLFLPGAYVGFFWLWDLLYIGLGKYRIPIAIEESLVVEKISPKQDEKNKIKAEK